MAHRQWSCGKTDHLHCGGLGLNWWWDVHDAMRLSRESEASDISG